MMDGPPARWIAPSTPPPPASEELAALTMASTAMRVISPTTNCSRLPVGNRCSIPLISGYAREDDFAPRAAQIHLVLDALDGRPREMPVHAQARRLAHARENLSREKRMNVVDRVDLGGGHLRPAGAQAREARRHPLHHEASLLAQRIGRGFAAADDVVRIERSFRQLACARHHECRRLD